MNKKNLRLFFMIFTASGFAGLIYESIWTHYLKLFLGHAAYAQALVLAIFMGGMALGSLICSKYSGRFHNLLIGYALIELAIGLCSIFFHPLYVLFIDLTYAKIIPALGSLLAVTIFKWLGASLIILPQSILLGMTFPLMTAGLIRRFPETPGSIVAMLYFTNSFGAAIGVLAAGFFFIEWAGLPGTLVIAGFINILVAAVVWLAEKNSQTIQSRTPSHAEIVSPETTPSFVFKIFLAVALLTGLSSFVYEIGWIRMLSLVLGSSTHAFELMLSAFIMGIAFGGYWIKRRIDAIDDPRGTLAFVQIAMGMLALATLSIYNSTFNVMAWLVKNLPKTESGYLLFNISSHGIALIIMLPAAFCAGMTLPLITTALLRKGYGERSIGAIYGFNTIGSILGVFIAFHLAMPLLGLKGMIILGAGIDIALGLALAWWVLPSRHISALYTASSLAALLISVFFVKLDPNKMASGLYRYQNVTELQKMENVFQRDGKTATVSVTKINQTLSIKTNGKSDASIELNEKEHTLDEETGVLLGVMGTILRPESRTAAVIGWGSGLTTHSLLTNPHIERVDTIEIEPEMVEAAKLFGTGVHLAYDDPRSHLFIDDAKSFFSSHNRKYDFIISEPSNPWVSGVASLFTREFYARVREYLKKDGLFIQWIQLYEIDMPLVASIMNALSSNFADYAIYTTNSFDILIIASPFGVVPEPSDNFLSMKDLMSKLHRIDVFSLPDINARKIGTKATLSPFFESYAITANSDYSPVVDLFAVKSRFLVSQAAEQFSNLAINRVPLVQMLEKRPADPSAAQVAYASYRKTRMIHFADAFYHYFMQGKWKLNQSKMTLFANTLQNAELARKVFSKDCVRDIQSQDWWKAILDPVARVLPFLTSEQTSAILQKIEHSACAESYSITQRDFLALLKAVGKRDPVLMARYATRMLQQMKEEKEINPDLLGYTLSAGMLGYLASDKKHEARLLWQEYGHLLPPQYIAATSIRLLVAQLSGKSNITQAIN